jgi:hypothetical protein
MQAKFKGDKSGFEMLNGSNLGHSMYRDKSQINFTKLNMSKVTAMRGPGEKSRFMDPPS